MDKSMLKKNSVYLLALFIRDFIVSLFQSVGLLFRVALGKNPGPLKENRALDSLNFALHIGPKSFWSAPNGLKIGRSLATFLHYVFHKEEMFQEKKK